MPKVFVYGTLKRGRGNFGVMERSKGRYIGDTKIDNKFAMISLGAFPAALKGIAGGCITGEVFEVEDMSPLDGLEGYPMFYDREIIETEHGDAWIYYLNTKENEDIYNNININKYNIIYNGIW